MGTGWADIGAIVLSAIGGLVFCLAGRYRYCGPVAGGPTALSAAPVVVPAVRQGPWAN